MNVSLPHARLDRVSAMAATLADRILMDRMLMGALPIAKAETLWIASLLLEENECPVPTIVTQVLAEFRHPEADNDAAPAFEAPVISDTPAQPRGLGRFFRPFRVAASA